MSPDEIVYGFTGSREGMTDRQAVGVKLLLSKGGTLHNGACIGADERCTAIAYLLKKEGIRLYTIARPSTLAQWTSQDALNMSDYVVHPYPPLDRNQHIVEMCHILIATPRTLQEERRSGTWYTIRAARKFGKPVIILDP